MRRLPAGSSISYGATFITGKDSFIAVLPLGYADGYTRRMSHKAEVLINGQRFPVVGTICMDQCMVDLGESTAQVGDEVILFGTQSGTSITADELASWSDTINYEVVCGISDRVPRLYIH
jgi:alanine racemase